MQDQDGQNNNILYKKSMRSEESQQRSKTGLHKVLTVKMYRSKNYNAHVCTNMFYGYFQGWDMIIE